MTPLTSALPWARAAPGKAVCIWPRAAEPSELSVTRNAPLASTAVAKLGCAARPRPNTSAAPGGIWAVAELPSRAKMRPATSGASSDTAPVTPKKAPIKAAMRSLVCNSACAVANST